MIEKHDRNRFFAIFFAVVARLPERVPDAGNKQLWPFPRSTPTSICEVLFSSALVTPVHIS